ncbi:hypothetical protein JP75_17175 [Devosia riboflavina]|uniref:AAA+ ATPase domain-containing protein n=1 Tax=Devosia riboflavina TaxID=46914 RepID=A0A087M094_9HYPH|nr:AAA family ATPase [Devosia riboflavina]KFL30297.1 hypothetical protein JP75_17175 [Devosia riboflavina]
MSLSRLNVPSASDDIDDTDDQAQEGVTPRRATERPGDALARLMLDAVLNRKLRRLMKAASRLIVIKTADELAARLMDSYLTGHDRAVAVEAYTELTRTGGRLEQQGRDDLRKLEHGRSVILISQDPERILVHEAMGSADAIIVLPPPDLAIIRKTIRAVTGRTVRGLHRPDIEELSIADLTTAIRPGLTSRECVINLRRAARNRIQTLDNNCVLALEDLAMTRPVAAWAFDTLRIMENISSGKIESTALRYACLEGPPGTGKTTVAAALAKSAGWNFVSTSVGRWFAESGGHLGDVIRAARRFFDEIALAKGPVVGLLDEIDGLPNRAAMVPSDSQWWTPVITFTLTEIDRLRQAGKPILLIGATNHIERLDAALIRPGRLETKVSVLLPDFDDRRRLFGGFLGDRISDDGVAMLARLAVTATPARIESWCRTALARAESENRKLALRDLVDLVAPADGRSAEKDHAVALHEAGHAIVAHDLGLPILEISILRMGTVGGWVNTRAEEQGLFTRPEIERLGTMILGGRAADMVLGQGAHAGAASDIDAVNTLLRSAMLDFGLYGSLKTAKNTDIRNFVDGVPLATAIEMELNLLLERAIAIVSRRREDIFMLVAVLLKERVVTGDRLNELLGNVAAAAPSEEETIGDSRYPRRSA